MSSSGGCISCQNQSGSVTADDCFMCLGTTGSIFGHTATTGEICALAALNVMGVQVNPPSTPTGSVWTLQIQDGQICIDTKRASNAWDTVNKQLPGGSLQSYLSSIFSASSASLSSASRETLYVLTGILILFGFLLYSIICIALMAYGFVGVGVGITLLIIGMLMGILAFFIILTEISSFVSKLETELYSQVDPAINTISCALVSGLCCYSGAKCCCSSATGYTCANIPGLPCEEM